MNSPTLNGDSKFFFYSPHFFQHLNDCIQRRSRLIELETEIGTIPWNSEIDRNAAFGGGTIRCFGVKRDQGSRKKKQKEVPRQVNGSRILCWVSLRESPTI